MNFGVKEDKILKAKFYEMEVLRYEASLYGKI